jgi:hypothetical protein
MTTQTNDKERPDDCLRPTGKLYYYFIVTCFSTIHGDDSDERGWKTGRWDALGKVGIRSTVSLDCALRQIANNEFSSSSFKN